MRVLYAHPHSRYIVTLHVSFWNSPVDVCSFSGQLALHCNRGFSQLVFVCTAGVSNAHCGQDEGGGDFMSQMKAKMEKRRKAMAGSSTKDDEDKPPSSGMKEPASNPTQEANRDKMDSVRRSAVVIDSAV